MSRSALDAYSWTERSDGTWVRRLMGDALLFTEPNPDGKFRSVYAGFLVAAAATRSRGEWAAELTRAWLWARFRAPALGCSLEVEGETHVLVYKAFESGPEAQEWAEGSLFCHDAPTKGAESALRNGLFPNANGDFHVHAFFDGDLTDTFTLYLYGGHFHIDAGGLAALLGILIACLADHNAAQPDWGNEVDRLPLPPQTLAGLRRAGAALSDEQYEEMERAVERMQVSPKHIYLETPQIRKTENLHSFSINMFKRTFSREESSKFFAACKRLGKTVNEMLTTIGFLACYRTLVDCKVASLATSNAVFRVCLPFGSRARLPLETRPLAPIAANIAFIDVPAELLKEELERKEPNHCPTLDPVGETFRRIKLESTSAVYEEEFYARLESMFGPSCVLGANYGHTMSHFGVLDEELGPAVLGDGYMHVSHPVIGTASFRPALCFFHTFTWQGALSIKVSSNAWQVAEETTRSTFNYFLEMLESVRKAGSLSR